MNVKELADICQVHYNTMRKWLADNNVEKKDDSKNSPYLISEDIIRAAKKNFLNKDQEKYNETVKTDEILVKQIEQKDIQIVKQQEQINHLHKLLENQQILTLKAQERVQLLESKKTDDSNNKKNFGEWLKSKIKGE